MVAELQLMPLFPQVSLPFPGQLMSIPIDALKVGTELRANVNDTGS